MSKVKCVQCKGRGWYMDYSEMYDGYLDRGGVNPFHSTPIKTRCYRCKGRGQASD